MGIDVTELDLNFTPERVKGIRILLGLTQEQFAEKVGVDGNMVSRWERGEATPTKGPNLTALLKAEREATSA